MVKHETVRPKKDGAWEALFRLTSSFIFKGLEGSSFDFNDGKITGTGRPCPATESAAEPIPARTAGLLL